MILPVSRGNVRQVTNLQGWLLRNNVLLSVTMSLPSMRASPMMDVVLQLPRICFHPVETKLRCQWEWLAYFFLSKAYYGDHVLRSGVQAPPGNFILVIVGLLHPVCPHDPETYHTSVIICLASLCRPGHAVAYLVEALCCKPEGRGIESRWGGFFSIYLILPAALWSWGLFSL
jgi:hypothetical protein